MKLIKYISYSVLSMMVNIIPLDASSGSSSWTQSLPPPPPSQLTSYGVPPYQQPTLQSGSLSSSRSYTNANVTGNPYSQSPMSYTHATATPTYARTNVPQSPAVPMPSTGVGSNSTMYSSQSYTTYTPTSTTTGPSTYSGQPPAAPYSATPATQVREKRGESWVNDLQTKVNKAKEFKTEIQQNYCMDLRNRPVMVVGDLHGDIISLEACLTKFRNFVNSLPFSKKQIATLVFLGDYLDRGPHSAEIIRVLTNLKSSFPHNIYFLRGNHEDIEGGAELIWNNYGFSQECRDDFQDPEAIKNIVRNFIEQSTNIYAKAGNKNVTYHLMHGYIPSTVRTSAELDDLFSSFDKGEKLERKPGLQTELLWNDPGSITGENTRRGAGMFIAKNNVDAFLGSRDKIVRAHEIKKHNVYSDFNTYNIFSSYFVYGGATVDAPINKKPVASVLTIDGDVATPIELTDKDIKNAIDSLAKHCFGGISYLQKISQVIDATLSSVSEIALSSSSSDTSSDPYSNPAFRYRILTEIKQHLDNRIQRGPEGNENWTAIFQGELGVFKLADLPY